jgi:hypothetical protein
VDLYTNKYGSNAEKMQAKMKKLNKREVKRDVGASEDYLDSDGYSE